MWKESSCELTLCFVHIVEIVNNRFAAVLVRIFSRVRFWGRRVLWRVRTEEAFFGVIHRPRPHQASSGWLRCSWFNYYVFLQRLLHFFPKSRAR